MIIRRPKIEEIEALKQLHKPFSDEFKFPNVGDVESIYVAVDGDKIVGFGALQLIYEATIVLNQDVDKWSRFEALDLLQTRAEEELTDKRITQVHAFVQNAKFGNLLKNRFGYKPTKGSALVKVIDNG